MTAKGAGLTKMFSSDHAKKTKICQFKDLELSTGLTFVNLNHFLAACTPTGVDGCQHGGEDAEKGERQFRVPKRFLETIFGFGQWARGSGCFEQH